MFKVIKKDKKTKARLGVLSTPHGKIRTPSYVFVGTYGKIRHLTPRDIKRTKTQLIIANTFHLWKEAVQGPPLLQGRSLLVKKLGLNMPTMTDSGGFQIFSLGFSKNRIGKILTPFSGVNPRVIHRRKNIKITDQGVNFYIGGGRKKFLGPALSIKLQEKLGADIIFAFDECTSPLDSYTYNKKALERTHRWAKKCLKEKKRKDQMLFGIVQGGKFKNLRIKSAKFIGSLPFDGVGIGGSFGKDEMVKTLKWVMPLLPEEKPRHLLGIGRIKDVFNAVENGVDLFDCVIPTREARHGRIYTKNGYYDVRKSIYSKNKLHKLFKGNEKQKLEGQKLATIQNVLFFNNLLIQIRQSIKWGKFTQFKKTFLTKFNKAK